MKLRTLFCPNCYYLFVKGKPAGRVEMTLTVPYYELIIRARARKPTDELCPRCKHPVVDVSDLAPAEVWP